MDLGPVVMEFFEHRIGNRTAHAAADHADLFLSLRLGGLTQGAHEVLQTVALLELLELFRGSTYSLDNDGDSSLVRVIVIDGNRNPLSLFVHPQNDELAGLGLLGNQRGLDLIPVSYTHLDPTVMIGGTLPLLHSGYRVGQGDTIILESCEYCNSFLSFFPTVAVILNVEADHLDFFLSLIHI